MTRPSKSRTAPKKIDRDELARQAVALRRQGLTYEQIGERMGVTVSTAYRYVVRAMEAIREHSAEDASAVREIESQRLDELQRLVSARLDEPEDSKDFYAAVSAALRIMERRAKLLGLDRPTQIEVASTSAVYRVEIPGPQMGPHSASAGAAGVLDIEGEVDNETGDDAPQNAARLAGPTTADD